MFSSVMTLFPKILGGYSGGMVEQMGYANFYLMTAVIGIPDDQYGEEIKACVVLKEGHEVSAEELSQWTKEHIAAYKYPRIIEFLDALPQSATGKILKKVLRQG